MQNLTFEQLDALHRAMGEVCAILNPERKSLLELSNDGEEEALHMEIFEIKVFAKLCKKAKELKK